MKDTGVLTLRDLENHAYPACAKCGVLLKQRKDNLNILDCWKCNRMWELKETT